MVPIAPPPSSNQRCSLGHPNSYKYCRFNKYMLKCELCEDLYAEFRCRSCGRYVCEKHFDKGRGICIACVESGCNICFKYLAIGICALCKRMVCSGCSIDIDGVRRICVYCLIKSSLEYQSIRSKMQRDKKLTIGT
ncbi:MAG: hypothetical protein QW775_02680 [Ignisphaera sp.]|uniref:B box-type domain-containing protein n=1 Tax=Ignisphaera aggregans TaxID=334771 RepID=A0A7C4JJW9_9CREN